MTNKVDRSVNALRRSRLIGVFVVWFILTGLATSYLVMRGTDPRIAGAAAGLCLVPAVLTLLVAFFGRSWPPARRAALVCMPWVLMSGVFVVMTGGLASPALVFTVFPPLLALAFGWRGLAVETAAFSLLATLGAIGVAAMPFAVSGGYALHQAAQAYSIAGLCALPFLLAGFIRQTDDAPAADTEAHAWPAAAAPVAAPHMHEGPAPLDEPPGHDADEAPRAILDIGPKGRVRSISGSLPAGLALKVHEAFIDGFPPASRDEAEQCLATGGTFWSNLETGSTVEVTVDRNRDTARVFLVELTAAAGAGRVPETAPEAQAAIAERTAFFASLSHELKTPLNAILGFAEIMRLQLRGPVPDAYRDYASLIHESGQDLLLIVEDILDYSKSETGHASLDCEPVDLVASADSVMAQLSAQAQRAGVTLTLKAEGEVWAQADARAVRQIWQNLISNAIKYSEQGGEVILDAREGQGTAALSVQDHGAGMEAADLERVAQPFQQGRNSKGRAGTGLGLAVVKSFADLMQGKVIIDTAPGEGTRVRVILPQADAADLGAISEAAE